MASPILLSVCLTAAAILLRQWLLRRGRRLPPGPKGWPIVGNFDAMGEDKEHTWLRYAEWAREYGDMTYLEVFGQPTIILNSVEATTELLEKRSNNYSDRPDLTMVNELMKWDWDMVHMRYSDGWRLHRKTFHQYFHSRHVDTYYPVQLRSTGTMLQSVLHSPDNFIPHIRYHAGSIVLKVTYGYDAKPLKDPYVALAEKAMESLGHAIHAGHYVVDFVPILKHIPSWFPGASFKRKAKEWSKSALALKNRPFEDLKASMAMADGPIESCFVTENLERMKRENGGPEMEEVIKNAAGIAYLAGSDTTVSVVLSFILAMALYPDVQARAQAELDSVLGSSKLPDFEDRPSLPYVEAVFTEALRWMPVTPLAVPHKNIDADEYKGYYIPPGTTIVPNVWAVLHDPSVYYDPSAFNPERFLSKPGKTVPPHPENYSFGFGRRICPGRFLAMNTAWIAIVSLLAVFDLKKAVDEKGQEIIPVVDCTDGVVVHPVPFKCSIKPRSRAAADLIAQGYEIA